MVDKSDMIANADRPIVQESAEHDHHVELIIPEVDDTIVMDDAVAAALCADIMRVVSGIDPSDIPANDDRR